MKAGLVALPLALSFLMISPAFATAEVDNPGGPQYANMILNGFVTPTESPGDRLEFSFNLTNPYTDDTDIMEGVALTIGVYKYSTQETTLEVNSSFKHAPILDHLGIQVVKEFDRIASGDTRRVEVNISTSTKTPHGSIFSQSSYFMRFKLSFNFSGNSTPVVLQSRGFFTDEEWTRMVIFTDKESIINTTYMRSLGVDGLLPDSAFGLKQPIPKWPLGIIFVGIGVLSFMSLYYFVLDNPGKYPRLEQRFYYLRGKSREFRSQLKDRRRK
jgi:hypothetical protein